MRSPLFTIPLLGLVFYCLAYLAPSQSKPVTDTRLKDIGASLKKFATANKYNREIGILVDMSISSGQYRMFIYDLRKDSILSCGLLAHGSCDKGFQDYPEFSNTVNSGCSSLGRYRIGGKYVGSFGTAYKLYGLDSSNSNAFQRNIVLHGYDGVPEKESDLLPICNSRGCPMVAPGFLLQLKKIIDASKRPMILWIF